MLSRDEKIMTNGIVVVFVLLCIANVLFLPPYEGFDETAHYSYISVLSDRHEIPNFSRTPLDATMEDSLEGLPHPYNSKPPFKASGGISYKDFFRDDRAGEREEAAKRFWQEPQKTTVYTPGQKLNWQGQHPPLYYFLMGFPYRLARSWPPGMRLLLLRLCSVALACGSLLFWYKTITLFQSPDSRRLLLLGGLAAIFFPSLFYDFARLGNDSLVTLLFAGSFYFLLATYVHRQERLGDFVGLGCTLGLGLLTKLFFLPLLVGAVLCSLWLGFRYTKIGLWPLFLRVSLLVGISLLLAGGWFGLFHFRYGVLVGSTGRAMRQPILSPWRHELSVGQFLLQMLRAAGGFFTTFFWCGTWSWVRPPLYLYVCIVPLVALTVCSLFSFFVHEPAQAERRQIVISALLFLVPLLLGFVYHMYLMVRSTGWGFGTPGHYLFVTWPVIGMMFALPFEKMRTGLLKEATLIAFALLSVFEAAGWWRSALVYSGVVEKVGNLQTGIGFLSPTIDALTLVLDRLRTLAFPHVAVILYGMAFLLRSALATWVIFSLPPLPSPSAR